VVVAIHFLAEVFVFECVGPSGIVLLPMSIKLVVLMAQVRGWTKEGFKEFSGILVVWGEDGFGRE